MTKIEIAHELLDAFYTLTARLYLWQCAHTTCIPLSTWASLFTPGTACGATQHIWVWKREWLPQKPLPWDPEMSCLSLFHYPHASTNMCSILLKAWFPSTSKGIAPLEFWTSKPTVASIDANSLHHPTLQELHDKTTVLNDLVFNARKAFYVAVKDSGYTMCIINCDQMCAHSSLIL